MKKQLWIVLAAVVLGSGSAGAKLSAQQQTYFNLLKGKMISNVNSVSSSGVRGGETNVALPGMEGMGMGMSSKDTLHLCSDGSYIRNLVDEAMGMKSSSRQTGKWTVGRANSAGFALMLTPKGNKVAKALNLSFDGERTVVNDERWYRMKSSACK
ncbi:MAG: hypothetical protein H7095_05490 [Pseudopedobacter sp.]|nr:hypothetical protein [Deinococcales bacterium]